VLPHAFADHDRAGEQVFEALPPSGWSPVLTDVEGDAVFVFEGEYVELVRINGVLRVNTATDFRTPDLIALLPPHELAEVDYR
jgi:hypothetical protein